VAKIRSQQAQLRRWAAQAEAAEYLGIDPKTLRRMVAKGQVTGYRMGPRLIRFDLDELDALMRPIPTTKAG
jgi:excisionase family DNA binding protein